LPDVMVIHDTLLPAVHPQAPAVVTETEPLPPLYIAEAAAQFL